MLFRSDARAARTIDENLRRARVVGGIVVRRDAIRFLDAGSDAAGAAAGPFAIVLADPPYAEPALVGAALERLADARLGWLGDDAVVIVKHFWRDQPPERVGRLRRTRVRRFGETALSDYAVAAADEAGEDPT